MAVEIDGNLAEYSGLQTAAAEVPATFVLHFGGFSLQPEGRAMLAGGER